VAKEGRNPDTRKKILDVAEGQFAAKGYTGAHLQSIAKEVGVQKTALYYYFSSKEALYVAILERILESMDRLVRAAMSRGGPSVETLEVLFDDLNDILAANPNYSRILIRIFVDRIQIDSSAIEPIVARIIDRVLTSFAAGVDKGAFQKLSSRHTFLTVLGAMVFYYAAGDTSNDILGIDDIFSPGAVEWRRQEVRRLLIQGIMPR
jgi:TetR/AcrR family transcriptional regulator